MTEPLILPQLRTKRDQILDAVAYHEAKLGEAKAHLTHVNAVIALYEAEGTAEGSFPSYMNLNRLLSRGEMVEAAKAALQASGRPMTTREIAEAFIRAKGWDEADVSLRQAVTYRLVQALTRAVRRKVLADAGRRARGVRVWALREG